MKANTKRTSKAERIDVCIAKKEDKYSPHPLQGKHGMARMKFSYLTIFCTSVREILALAVLAIFLKLHHIILYLQ